MFGLASGAAVAMSVAWYVWPNRMPEPEASATPAPVQEAARQQEAAVPPQATGRQAAAPTPTAAFEARFKASRERPRPPPDPAILNAPTFAEAFQAMKRSESQPVAENAGANPFAPARQAP
jgi:hypothetical protein